jgi:hypothetical protein
MSAMETRIAAAFGEGALSEEVSVVLAEVEAAAEVAEAAAVSARSRALDPVVTDIKTARQEMHESAFERDRLAEAAKRLAERVEILRTREAHALRASQLERLLAERTRLAEALSRMTGPITEIACIVAAIDLCELEMRAYNFTHLRPVLADASPIISTLFNELFVADAFRAVARLR